MPEIGRREYKKSFLLDDVESHASGPGSLYGSQIFRLKSLMSKTWKCLMDVNMIICQNDIGLILKQKPIFDEQKLRMIRIDAFVERDIQCGTLLAIRQRNPFEHDCRLCTDSQFNEWNELAIAVNTLLDEINATICAELQIKLVKGVPKTILSQKSKALLFWVLILFAIIGFLSTSYIIGLELAGGDEDDTGGASAVTSSGPDYTAITVYVETPRGRTAYFIHQNDSIASLKVKIFETTGVRPDKQHLSHASVNLSDEGTFSSQHISDNAILQLSSQKVIKQVQPSWTDTAIDTPVFSQDSLKIKANKRSKKLNPKKKKKRLQGGAGTN